MGKKDKAKKKGKGAEKTAEKTQKKLKQKIKKETGEDDIECMVKAIEDEERQRAKVTEQSVGPPSHRSNFSIVAHPECPEVVLFGGEFYNGQKTLLFRDLLFFDTKRNSWTQVSSPSGPPSRCSHQAVVSAQAGGQMWVFGGEYVSPSETQFHHYKDLWCYHFASRRWEKINAVGGPSSRSGHRMVLVKRHLIVFGGFNDNGRECKYFNDVHAFDIDNMKWKKLEITGVAPPSPRSACNMFALGDGRVVIFGGYRKEKAKKDSEKGISLSDMFALAPDKNDATMTKWRWHTVKQTGTRPSVRTGMAVTVDANHKAYFFGGVQDEDAAGDDEDDDDINGNFFNDLYSVVVENERATWTKVQLLGKKEVGEKKRRRRAVTKDNEADESQDSDDQEDAMEDAEDGMDELRLQETEAKEKASTVTVEEGAFTITSTVDLQPSSSSEPSATADASGSASEVFWPSPRFGTGLVIRQGILYLFGGMFEDGDKTITLNDFYSLDLHKLDEWKTLIKSDVQTMEWVDSDSSDSGEDDSDDSDEDDEEDGDKMDTD